MEASPVFELNHETLAATPRFAEIATALSDLSPIDSDETFNRYCREACRLWRENFRNPVGETSPRFGELLEQIERRSQTGIKTDRRGVVLRGYEHPRGAKFLVITE